jgi:hypothetical protein
MSPWWSLDRPQSRHPGSNGGPSPYEGAARPAVLCRDAPLRERVWGDRRVPPPLTHWVTARPLASWVRSPWSTWSVPPRLPPRCGRGALLMSYTSFCATSCPPCRHSGSNGDPRGKSPLGLPLPHTGVAGLLMLGCVRRPGVEPGVSRVSGERRDRLARGGWSRRVHQAPPLCRRARCRPWCLRCVGPVLCW